MCSQVGLRSVCFNERHRSIDEIFVRIKRGHICSIPKCRPTIPGKTENTDSSVEYDRELLTILAHELGNPNYTTDSAVSYESYEMDTSCTEVWEITPTKYQEPSPLEFVSSLEPEPKRRKILDEIDLLFSPYVSISGDRTSPFQSPHQSGHMSLSMQANAWEL